MLCTDWNETWVVASHHVTDMSAMMRLSWVRSLPSNGALNIQQLRASESPASQLSLTMIVCTYIHCVPKKTCDHVFDDKLKQNCPFTKIFGTLITKSTGHWQVFLFSHLTYFMQLLYLGKLSIPKYQQKLNKIMKISQEDAILIKNLYLSKQYGARRLLRELPDKGWKLWSIDSLLKRSHKTGTIVPLPGSSRPHLSLSSEGPMCSVRRTSQKSNGQLVRFRMNLPFAVQVYTEK